MLKNILVLLLIPFIYACGYQLRGNVNLSENLKYIYLQGASDKLRNIFSSQSYAGATLAKNKQEAKIVVQIIKEKTHNNVLSLGISGRANEYKINYTIDFIVLETTKNKTTSKQTIKISQDYFNNQEDVLGKFNEEIIIKDELIRQAVEGILLRIPILLNNLK